MFVPRNIDARVYLIYTFRDLAEVNDPLYSKKFDRFDRKFDVSDSIFFIS